MINVLSVTCFDWRKNISENTETYMYILHFLYTYNKTIK